MNYIESPKRSLRVVVGFLHLFIRNWAMRRRAFAITVLLLGATLFMAEDCNGEVVFEPRPPGEWDRVRALVSEEIAQNTGKGSLTGSPYTSYSLDLTAIRNEKPVFKAKEEALNYLVIKDGTFLGAAQLDSEIKDVVGFYKNNGVTADLWNALKGAKLAEQVKAQDFSVRYIGSGTLLFAALWLHSSSGDFFIPLGNTFERWSKLKVYSLPEMVKLLHVEALKQIPGDAIPKNVPPIGPPRASKPRR
jgi:hypothetical protein